jgi:hypothetical protein
LFVEGFGSIFDFSRGDDARPDAFREHPLQFVYSLSNNLPASLPPAPPLPE